MIDWLVEIETPDGVTSDADTLVLFRENLEELLGETGTAASIDTLTGSLHATFSLPAPNPEKATEAGLAAFRKALALSGLALDEPVRAAVERIPADESIPA